MEAIIRKKIIDGNHKAAKKRARFLLPIKRLKSKRIINAIKNRIGIPIDSIASAPKRKLEKPFWKMALPTTGAPFINPRIRVINNPAKAIRPDAAKMINKNFTKTTSREPIAEKDKRVKSIIRSNPDFGFCCSNNSSLFR